MTDTFEDDLKVALGDKILDDAIAESVWSALANTDWYHPESKKEYSCSFRHAGYLIAEMRGSGGYMDWYCCAPYAVVSDFIARSMKKRGWIYNTQPEICDEPDCLQDAGCGWPTKDGGYRRTCGEHMRQNEHMRRKN